MNSKIILLVLIVVIALIYTLGEGNKENFGALQSLYSNDGIQDAYLTTDNDGIYTDAYKYWRGVPWDLPTRNLGTLESYPYLYEYHLDRYAMLYPYWSL